MHLRTLSVVAFLLLSAGCHVRPESLVPGNALEQTERHSEFLRGSSASFVVLGDATSFVWPTLLQEMLDAHARSRNVYRVRNGAAEDAAIEAWKEGSGPLDVLEQEVEALRADRRSGAAPMTALCLVTLRGLGDE